jgi:hypothetical protein
VRPRYVEIGEDVEFGGLRRRDRLVLAVKQALRRLLRQR